MLQSPDGMAATAPLLLARLERLLPVFDAGASLLKRRLVWRLRHSALPSAGSILRLHESLLFLRAYPDDPVLLCEVDRALDEFANRPDLRRHRERLADSGIEGTPIHYRFFWPQAMWLAERWPKRLTLDRDDPEPLPRLREALALLAGPAEGEAIAKLRWSVPALIDYLKSTAETDAAFVLRRLAATPGDDRTRERLHDAIDVTYRLEHGVDGPSRARRCLPVTQVQFRTTPPDRGRPDLRVTIPLPPRRVRQLPAEAAARMIESAREAMVTRARELEVFSWASSDDVHFVDDGDGLAFVFIGLRPQRRPLLHASYAALILRNGVPIGYYQCDVLLQSGSISYNTFETFRGGEAAFVFARVLAATHHLFGTRLFTVEPYQLGHQNAEGLDSGAWWFYRKLGFVPRDAPTERLARSEELKILHDPRYRSTRTTLRRLAKKHLFFELSPDRVDTTPPLPWPVGLLLAPQLRRQGCVDRELALLRCERLARRLAGGAEPRPGSDDERDAWRKLSPLLLAIRGFRHWPVSERRAAALALCAKGAQSELGYLRQLADHRRLALALERLGRRASRLAARPMGPRSGTV